MSSAAFAATQAARLQVDCRLHHLVKGRCGSAISALGMLHELIQPCKNNLPEETISLIEASMADLKQVVWWCNCRQVFMQLEDRTYVSSPNLINVGDFFASFVDSQVNVVTHVKVVRVDETILHLALSEVLSNALKFRREGTTICIHARHSHGMLQVEVSNVNAADFVPPTPEEAKLIFSQGDKAKRFSVMSDGVGLDSIALAMAAVDGSIALECTPDVTVVRISMPDTHQMVHGQIVALDGETASLCVLPHETAATCVLPRDSSSNGGRSPIPLKCLCLVPPNEEEDISRLWCEHMHAEGTFVVHESSAAGVRSFLDALESQECVPDVVIVSRLLLHIVIQVRKRHFEGLVYAYCADPSDFDAYSNQAHLDIDGIIHRGPKAAEAIRKIMGNVRLTNHSVSVDSNISERPSFADKDATRKRSMDSERPPDMHQTVSETVCRQYKGVPAQADGPATGSRYSTMAKISYMPAFYCNVKACGSQSLDVEHSRTMMRSFAADLTHTPAFAGGPDGRPASLDSSCISMLDASCKTPTSKRFVPAPTSLPLFSARRSVILEEMRIAREPVQTNMLEVVREYGHTAECIPSIALRVVGIDDEHIPRMVQGMFMKHHLKADPDASVVLGKNAKEIHAFVDVALGLLNVDLTPNEGQIRPADVALLDENIAPPDILGSLVAAELRRRGFEGLVVLLTGTSAAHAEQLRRLPEVDLVVDKGFPLPQMAEQIKELVRSKDRKVP